MDEMYTSEALGKKNLFLESSLQTNSHFSGVVFTLISVVKFYDTTALEVEGSSPHLICCCWSSQFLPAREVFK